MTITSRSRGAKHFAALILGTLLVLFLATAPSARADVYNPADWAPQIWSDKDDYPPGALVTLTGAHWQPGESVHIYVNDDEGRTWSRDVDVTADQSGNITDQFNLPDWFVATYSVKATGASGTVATTTFADSVVAMDFPTDGATYTAATWNGGCATTAGDLCGTSGGGNGGAVDISIKRNSDGTYWNGSSFTTSASERFVSATMTQTSTKNTWSWSYSFPASNFPANGSYTAVARITNASNEIMRQTRTFTVTTAAATSLAVASATATYGGTAALSATLTSGGTAVAGKTIAFTLNNVAVCGAGTEVTCPTTDSAGVASLSGVSVAGMSAGTYAGAVAASFSADASYGSSSGSNSLTVQKKALSGNFSAANKVYDGNATATITGSSLVAGGVVEGDSVSLNDSGATAAFADKNVGTGKTVTASGFTLSGTDAGNYSLSMNTTTANITARPIRVTADAKSKVYGDSDPQLTYEITSGALAGTDSLSGSLTRQAGETVAGSPYAIQQGTLTAGDNYDLTYVGANLTITKKALSVNADDKSKVYGDADPTPSWNLSGFIAGENAANAAISGAAECSIAASAGPDVGEYAEAITCVAGNLSAPNYSFAAGAKGKLTITQRAITVAADAKSKLFGDADPALTWQRTSGSLVGSDQITGSLTRVAGEAVGSYAIQQGSLTAGNNYDLTYVPALLTIGAWTPLGFHAPVGVANSFYQAPGAAVPTANASTVWQSAKGGSVIPLKFNIFAGNVEKTSTADVKGFGAVKLGTCSGSTLDPVEELLTSGSTSLRYDSTEKQFIQNWKTSTVSGDTCYRVTVTFQDATAIHTFVRLRK